MPKPSIIPTLYDKVLQLNIRTLKRDGFLTPGIARSGTLSWRDRHGERTASIGITVDMCTASPYVELNYKFRDEPRKYIVRLVSVPSNLGSGEVWYFLCPNTNKRCRILYLVGGWFLHREAFSGVYYDSQIQSQSMRRLKRLIAPVMKADQYYSALHKKYFKTHYAGQPTKRYLELKKRIRQAESIPIDTFEKVLAGIIK